MGLKPRRKGRLFALNRFNYLYFSNMMSIEELAQLGLIKTVIKKNNRYSINNAPYQTVDSLLAFLFKNKNITLDKLDLISYLDNLAQDEKITEKMIQEKIQKMFGGKREVHTPVGFIDLVTDDMIVECKIAKEFKHAIGQIISYHKFFSNHEKAIYLFGSCPTNITKCYELCRENKIRLYAEFW